jgi:C4-dicarboxylate-specific signal transduction histidine kinase
VVLKYDADAFKGFLIECRLTQLSQVLLNALNNSFDAISNLDDKWIDLSILKENQKYIFRITDSGHGIPVHVQNKVMQPFFTTKDVGKGTGLGLSLSKSIVDAHHGRIYFNFDHPTNTQLVIEIPEFQSIRKAA